MGYQRKCSHSFNGSYTRGITELTSTYVERERENKKPLTESEETIQRPSKPLHVIGFEINELTIYIMFGIRYSSYL